MRRSRFHRDARRNSVVGSQSALEYNVTEVSRCLGVEVGRVSTGGRGARPPAGRRPANIHGTSMSRRACSQHRQSFTTGQQLVALWAHTLSGLLPKEFEFLNCRDYVLVPLQTIPRLLRPPTEWIDLSRIVALETELPVR
jgi:hypothetical protein